MKTLILAIVASFLLATAAMAAVPPAGHVFVVVEENHSYSSVIGNSSMPYLNSLASQYGLATAYYANTHPSIGNYFMLTTGQIITNNDSYMSTVYADNLVRHMLTAGKTWKSYAESLPYAGYTGGDTGAYARRHNPFSYFSDVVNSSVQKMNLVPFTQFATDRANGALPEFSFIVPNIYDDAHNGTLGQADYWLKTNIGPLVASTAFQQSNDVLVIVFDESYDTDTAYGGGHVAMVVVGPKVNKQYKSYKLYQHQNTLRMVSEALGLTTFPGAAGWASDMSDFFGGTPAPAPTGCTASAVGVNICAPTSGSTDASPVQVVAAAMGNHPISSMMLYVDNYAKYTTYSASMSTSVSLAAGTHNVTVKAWDNTGVLYTSSITITVGTSPSPSGCTASTVGVTICAPLTGTQSSTAVNFSAAAMGYHPISSMMIYVDNYAKYTTYSATLSTSLTLSAGSHSVTIKAWDNTGQIYTQSVSISVP